MGSTVGRGATNTIANLYALSPLLPKFDIAGNPAGVNKALVLGNASNPYTSQLVGRGVKELQSVSHRNCVCGIRADQRSDLYQSDRLSAVLQ